MEHFECSETSRRSAAFVKIDFNYRVMHLKLEDVSWHVIFEYLMHFMNMHYVAITSEDVFSYEFMQNIPHFNYLIMWFNVTRFESSLKRQIIFKNIIKLAAFISQKPVSTESIRILHL